MPGSPLDPRAAGTNRLIRDGATLVRNADDVLEALRHFGSGTLRAPDETYLAGEESPAPIPQVQLDAVRQVLGPTPIPMDDIARAASVGSARCAAILMELELSGIARTFAGGSAALNVAED